MNLKASEEIMKWAIVRGMECGDPGAQLLKVGEEYGEICRGFVRGKSDEVADGIGDMIIALTVLGLQLGLHVDRCVEDAFEVVKEEVE